MGKLTTLFLLCLVTISCKGKDEATLDSTLTNGIQDKQLKRYEIESGSIRYKSVLSGNVMGTTISGTGTETLLFKDWGAMEIKEEATAQTTTTTIFGKTAKEVSESHTMVKLDNGKSYSVDFKRKEIHQMDDLAMGMTKMFQKDADAGKVGKELLESMGGKLIGTEVVLGYECEIWDLMGIKQWLYKGVLLKTEGTLMGITTIKEAVSAKFNQSLPNSSFELPDFPVITEESFMDGESFDVDMDEMKENMEFVKNMSYEDWKEMVTADDPEMQAMSEEELRLTYDMIQKAIRMGQ
ncbi:hypothetical protein HPE56_09625 [Maribacter sp. ANRC-HE7]|uniref:DUF4412 domain-containing protein n=1 Tax=Maribacter aquimaris TaxID=2737171 RepID=A0ABR7V4E2_9FLAO|nr:hypothetical protein [Maribacter aquimaris]MBD0778052.1 hypothetical protein [Maribacter aquimaris]